jgi:methylenetetrahydrofolate reductase (NADPH)
MRDLGVFQSGDKILSSSPDVFIGAAASPFADPLEFRVDRLEKKIAAGANFIQTQSVYNLDMFNSWMDEVRSRGLDKKVHILAGVTPLKSVKMAERMKFHVPGVDIPDEIYNRIKKSSDVKSEGFNISLELINEIKKIKGISGIHITALFWEDIIPSLVKKVGLLPRP